MREHASSNCWIPPQGRKPPPIARPESGSPRVLPRSWPGRAACSTSPRPPLPAARAGVAIDVSEVEELRADLNRQMDAHVRTLDQLPTAVAIFDASQHLAFHNTAYRQLWGLDQAFLESGPSDTEILDRLRGTRKLPEQADFRSWKNDVLSAYRSIEPRETWWHLPDGRTLRVVANPNPRGGLTYLFDDVSDHIKLESRFNALMRVQGETPRYPRGGRGRVRFRRTPAAGQ